MYTVNIPVPWILCFFQKTRGLEGEVWLNNEIYYKFTQQCLKKKQLVELVVGKTCLTRQEAKWNRLLEGNVGKNNVGVLIDWLLTVWLSVWLTFDRLIDCLVDIWLTDWLFDWLIDWLNGILVSISPELNFTSRFQLRPFAPDLGSKFSCAHWIDSSWREQSLKTGFSPMNIMNHEECSWSPN